MNKLLDNVKGLTNVNDLINKIKNQIALFEDLQERKILTKIEQDSPVDSLLQASTKLVLENVLIKLNLNEKDNEQVIKMIKQEIDNRISQRSTERKFGK